MVGHPLHQPAGVDENQRDGMSLGLPGNRVQGLAPNFMGSNGAKFLLGRQFHGQFHVAPAAGVHDHAVRCTRVRSAVIRIFDVFVAHHETGHFRQGALRGRKPDAGYRLFRQLAQPLYRQHQVGAPLVVGDGVDLVEDQGIDVLESPAPAVRGKQDVQGLGRGDEDVRRALGHSLPLRRRGVAGAHGRRYLRKRRTQLLGQRADLRQGNSQVLLDVVGEGFQRRYVDDLGGLGQTLVNPLAHQLVNAGQEGGQRLARPGRRGDQGVASLGNGRPPGGLCLRRRVKPAPEPLLDDGMKGGQGHTWILAQRWRSTSI